jgi:hypothetical protein
MEDLDKPVSPPLNAEEKPVSPQAFSPFHEPVYSSVSRQAIEKYTNETNGLIEKARSIRN